MYFLGFLHNTPCSSQKKFNPQTGSYRTSAFELELVVIDEDVNNLLGVLSSNSQVINIDSNIFIFATIVGS